MKKSIILTLIVGSLFVSGCSCSVKDNVNENNENNNNNDVTVITDKDVTGEQNISGVLFENTKFEVKDGVTTIETKVTNRTGAEYQLDNYQMIITDKNGIVLTILTKTVDERLAKDEEKVDINEYDLDLSAATKVEYKINLTIQE